MSSRLAARLSDIDIYRSSPQVSCFGAKLLGFQSVSPSGRCGTGRLKCFVQNPNNITCAPRKTPGSRALRPVKYECDNLCVDGNLKL